MFWSVHTKCAIKRRALNNQTSKSFITRSRKGNVIGSVRIYICVQKKIVIERTRDLIYLKFVAKDFFPKIISSSAGENAGDSV